MTETVSMWLNLLIHLMPLIPVLVRDVEGAVDSFKNDPNAENKAKQAKQALLDLSNIVEEVIKGVSA
jgi:hypothetical protein